MKNNFITTVENCEDEPIHKLGLIQNHGALLAFNFDKKLCYYSENAQEILGEIPKLNEELHENHLSLCKDASQNISEYLENIDIESENETFIFEIEGQFNKFELIINTILQDKLIIADFEIKNKDDSYSLISSASTQQVINRFKLQKKIDSLLDTAVVEIRKLIRFDRVMAYRFNNDYSGDIVSESLSEKITDSFLNRRFPESDIPKQARKMYIENTLRIIADVNSKPVAIISSEDTEEIDLSKSVLRSVSPIHIEYLKNIGATASFSISIVVDGALWGLIACHNTEPNLVNYSLRATCELYCLIISSTIQQINAKSESKKILDTTLVLNEVKDQLLDSQDFSLDLFLEFDKLKSLIDSDASFVSYLSKNYNNSNINEQFISALIKWLNKDNLHESIFVTESKSKMPQEIQDLMGDLCGILAINICTLNKAWLVFLRFEQVKTIKWGGKPEKTYTHGEFGPRLTPRASFAEWKELVKGTAESWSKIDIHLASIIQQELANICNKHNAEFARVKAQLMGVLGHDLRDPINSISMAAKLQELTVGENKLTNRIQTSSGRMQRLVNQVMDLTKMQSGLGLGIFKSRINFTRLTESIIEESISAYPEVIIEKNLDENLMVDADADRMSQVIANLISNARHHGETGSKIFVDLINDEGKFVNIYVKNKGNPIPESLVKVLFDPYKRQSLYNDKNKSGLGLGLYITYEIVKGHGGEIHYSYENDLVVFKVSI